MSRYSEESPGLRLFEGYGVELEYMIVDAQTLEVKPIADELIQTLAGEPANEAELGSIACSNELVLHVFELKTNGPAHGLEGLDKDFLDGVRRADDALRSMNARLLPTAMHPFMDPARETKLWPHDQGEIYQAFDRIFDCRGHGWSNLQSTHLNLPFQGEDEFGRLHAAIRLVLPLLPALAASSPLVQGKLTGVLDNRLSYYRQNCGRVPSVTGQVVPEAVFTKAEYERVVLDPIQRDLGPLDPNGVLEPEWVNARGAIARFVRDSIEIRVLDVQECPAQDIAVLGATVAAVRALVEERWAGYADQRSIQVEPLARLFVDATERGDAAVVDDPAFLRVFGLGNDRCELGYVWQHLIDELIPSASTWRPGLDVILRKGCLARRIRQKLGNAPAKTQVLRVYRRLAECLMENRAFE